MEGVKEGEGRIRDSLGCKPFTANAALPQHPLLLLDQHIQTQRCPFSCTFQTAANQKKAHQVHLAAAWAQVSWVEAAPQMSTAAEIDPGQPARTGMAWSASEDFSGSAKQLGVCG